MNFIELQGANGSSVFINPIHISCMQQIGLDGGSRSRILLTSREDAVLYVKESPEEIIQKIKEGRMLTLDGAH